MKNSGLTSSILKVLFVFLFAVPIQTTGLFGQENKTIHLKMVKEMDGKKTVIDTIINVTDGDENIHLKKFKEFEGQKGNLTKMFITVDENGEKKVIKIKSDGMHKTIIKEEDGENSKVIFITGDGVDSIMHWVDSTMQKVIIIRKDADKKKEIIIKESINGEIKVIDLDSIHHIIYKSLDGLDSLHGKVREVVKRIELEIEIPDLENMESGDEDGRFYKLEETIEELENGDKKITRIVIIKKVSISDLSRKETKEFKSKLGTTIVENNLKLDDLKFYPNPNDGAFKVSFSSQSKEPIYLRVFDLNGRKVFEEKSNGGGEFSTDVDLANEQKGTYIFNIEQNNKSISKKILVK